MARLSASHRANICRLTIEISWELAEHLADYPEHLVDHSEELIADLRQVVAHRRAYVTAQETTARRENAKLDARGRNNRQAAIIAARELRRRTSRHGSNETRPQILAELAPGYGLTPGWLFELVRQHEARLRARVRARRNTRIVHLWRNEESDLAIAKATGVSKGTVQKVLRDERARLAAQRQEATA